MARTYRLPMPLLRRMLWPVGGLALAELPKVEELTLLVGVSYAQAWTLGKTAKRSVSETVRAWRDYPPGVLPMPHPSWRNNGWLKRNPWFEAEVAPYLRERVSQIIAS